MKLMLQIGVVFGICLIGEGISSILPIPVPSSVISMILLFALLLCGALKVDHIAQKANFLLDNMAFFFIPAGVGMMEQYDLLKNNLVQLVVICVVSTVLTFAATAFTVKTVIGFQNQLSGRTRKEGE